MLVEKIWDDNRIDKLIAIMLSNIEQIIEENSSITLTNSRKN